MTTGRLTRQELGWLLAQEARGAARILRQDVTLLSQPPPSSAIPAPPVVVPPPAPIAVIEAAPDVRVEASLNALDDAIDMLSQLEPTPASSKSAPRRGRIDLAALLWDLAPNATIAIEPGAGTEVFGEEGELRRIFHVLLSQTSVGGQESSQAPVRIRRQDDWIRVTADLGPEVSANTDLERRWISRMATRMGGQLELEGGTMSLLLPADASNDQSEVADLRKELVQAQQLGEAYARELASVFAAGQLPDADAPRDVEAVAVRRYELLVTFAGAVHRTLSSILRGLEDTLARGVTGPGVAAIEAQVSAGYGLLGELGRVAACPRGEAPERLDLARVTRDAVGESEARAARQDVRLEVSTPGDLYLSTRPRALSVMVRSLLDHAISATPRGATVAVRLTGDGASAHLEVRDGGPVVPGSARLDLLEHRVDPAALGRPPGLSLLVAHTVAGYLGCPLALTESADGASVVEGTIAAL